METISCDVEAVKNGTKTCDRGVPVQGWSDRRALLQANLRLLFYRLRRGFTVSQADIARMVVLADDHPLNDPDAFRIEEMVP